MARKKIAVRDVVDKGVMGDVGMVRRFSEAENGAATATSGQLQTFTWLCELLWTERLTWQICHDIMLGLDAVERKEAGIGNICHNSWPLPSPPEIQSQWFRLAQPRACRSRALEQASLQLMNGFLHTSDLGRQAPNLASLG